MGEISYVVLVQGCSKRPPTRAASVSTGVYYTPGPDARLEVTLLFQGQKRNRNVVENTTRVVRWDVRRW